jgi:hypothetical protein
LINVFIWLPGKSSPLLSYIVIEPILKLALQRGRLPSPLSNVLFDNGEGTGVRFFHSDFEKAIAGERALPGTGTVFVLS